MRLSKAQQGAIVGLVAAIIAALAAFGVIDLEGDDNPAPATSITITVGGAEVQADRDNQLEPAEQHEAGPTAGERSHPGVLTETPDFHEDTRDETPGVVPGSEAEKQLQEQVDAGKQQTEELAEETLGKPEPPAGAQAYSCPAAHVVNQSGLNGKRVGTALHFTVSGPGSLLVIRGLFNRPSFGASSNYGIELSGRCQQWVPNHRKAWAQGAANSAYFSIEIVTFNLTRAQWLAAPILRNGTLAALVRDLNRSIGAPLRRVDPVGCVWPAGITDHDALECGNTHWDVGKNFPWDVFIRQVRQGVGSSRKLEKWRRAHRIVHAQIRDGRSTVERRRRNRLLHRLIVRERAG